MSLAAKLLHLVAAVIWLGGMTFMLGALRPVAVAQLPPPARLPLLTAVLHRFFVAVWICVAVLLLTGTYLLANAGMKNAPVGWHLMLGIGLVMVAVFAHIYFAPFRRLKLAVAAGNWPEGARRIGQVVLLAKINLGLGWIAIAAVLLMK